MYTPVAIAPFPAPPSLAISNNNDDSYTGALRGGVVLVANPRVFLDGDGMDPRLAERFFLPPGLSLEVRR